MGQVYRAYDELLRRRVALKLLHGSDVTDDAAKQSEALERVLREARMAAALDHPNVVSIFDVGEHEGVAFIVMEFVLGQSLRTLVRGESPIETRVQWLADVARALSAAHRAGLVHRDIKPENVMVRNDGVVKVLDFGIARQSIDLGEAKRASVPPGGLPNKARELPAELRATLAGTIENGALVGTPGYMPPELMLRGRFDARSDQFAWGVMAFEVLASRMPWNASETDTAALIAGSLYDDPEPLAQLVPELSARFAAGVDRALSKDPAARFASMDELLEQSGAATSRTLVPPTRRADAADMALAATAASGPLIESLRAQSQRGREATMGTAPPAVTARPAVLAPSRSSRGLVVGFAGTAAVSLAVGAFVVARSHHTPPAPPRPSAPASPTTSAPRGPSFELQHVQRLTFDEGCEEFPSFSPDGRSVLFDAADGDDYHLFLLDTATGTRRRITSAPGWQFASDLSPDGRYAAYVARGGTSVRTEVVAIDGNTPPRVLGDGPVRPRFSRDGRCVWGGAHVAPTCYDFETGAVVRTLTPPHGEGLSYIVEAPDGRYFMRSITANGFETGHIRMMDRDLHDRGLFDSHGIEEAIDIAPGARSIVVARMSGERETQLWELPFDGSAPSAIDNPAVHALKGVRFSPRGDRVIWSDCGVRSDSGFLVPGDGRVEMRFDVRWPERDWADQTVAAVPNSSLLVVASDRRGTPELWVVDRSSRRQAHAIEGTTGAINPSVSPDGRFVVATIAGHGILVAALDGSSPPRALTTAAGDVFPTFSADARSIYFESRAEARPRVVVIDVNGGMPRAVLPLGTGRPSIAPDGRLAYVAYGGDEHSGVIHIRNLTTNVDRVFSPELGAGTFSPVAFSADMQRAAVTDYGRNVFAFDVATGHVIGRYTTGGEQVSGITFTPEGLLMMRDLWNGDLWRADVVSR
jgi:serine/threonine-protein kinase